MGESKYSGILKGGHAPAEKIAGGIRRTRKKFISESDKNQKQEGQSAADYGDELEEQSKNMLVHGDLVAKVMQFSCFICHLEISFIISGFIPSVYHLLLIANGEIFPELVTCLIAFQMNKDYTKEAIRAYHDKQVPQIYKSTKPNITLFQPSKQ